MRDVAQHMEDGDLALAHRARDAADASYRLIGCDIDMAAFDAVCDHVTTDRDMSLLSRIADLVVRTGEAGPCALVDDREMVRQSLPSATPTTSPGSTLP